jgi:nucleotide-binding universal stress UspA family protein
MFKQLLVPLDGSHMAEAALPVAEGLARKFHAKVTLFHVVETKAPKEIHGERHFSTPQEALTCLQQVAQQTLSTELQVETRVQPDSSGQVAQEIAQAARELKADLIVMCTHGRGGVKHMLFGSIAQQVLSSAVIPVLLVPPLDDEPRRPFSCHKLLVPLDGNSDHELGLHTATQLAETCKSEIHILLIVRTPETLKKKSKASAKWLPNAWKFLMELRERAAQKYLDDQMDAMKDKGLIMRSEVRRGDPALVVLQVSKEKHIDMIVLGTHGTHGAAAFWSESVTPKISHRTHIPMLLIPVMDSSSNVPVTNHGS